MLLKQKQSGIIKGHGCADGRKHHLYVTKEENSAPTVLTESLMISCVIDAIENRDISIVDITGDCKQIWKELCMSNSKVC